MSDLDRFMQKVEKVENGCWYWTASKNKKGYGHFLYAGACQQAHRVSWILFRGLIPEGVWVLHSCDFPSCVNPDHLFLGTALDNAQDRDSKGRQKKGWEGVKINTAKLTEDQVKEIRLCYAQGGTTYKKLAAEYGVSFPMIGFIVRGDNWKHVK